MLSLHLNLTSEYALRAMATLAQRNQGGALPAKALADATGIPQHYLSKIMKRLVNAGLVSSRKGHGGGFILSRDPREIRYIEILAACGYESPEERCVFGWARCNSEAPCPLHDSWVAINDTFKCWASDTSLAEPQ